MRKLILLLVFLGFIISITLFYPKIHRKIERNLTSFILSKLPAKSSIGELHWNIFSELNIKELKIGDNIFIDNFSAHYLPTIVKRKIKNISIDGIKYKYTKGKNKKKERKSWSLPTKFSIGEITIVNGKLQFESHILRINGMVSAISTGKELNLSIKNMNGYLDSINVKQIKGDVSFTKTTAFFNIYNIRSGNTVISAKGNIDSFYVMGNIDLSILNFFTGRNLEGNVLISLNKYGKKYEFKGSSKFVKYENYSLDSLRFSGKTDKNFATFISFDSNGLNGTISLNKRVDASLNLDNLNLNALLKSLPSSNLYGKIDISYKKLSEFSLTGNLNGFIEHYPLSKLNLEVKGLGESLYVKNFKIISPSGNIESKLVISRKDFKGNGLLICKNLEIPPFSRFAPLDSGLIGIEAKLSPSGLSGIYWIEKGKSKTISFEYLGGNIELSSLFPPRGHIDTYLQNIRWKNLSSSISYVSADIDNNQLSARGLIKSGKGKLRFLTDFDFDSLAFSLKELSLEIPGDTIILSSPTRIILKNKLNMTNFNMSDNHNFNFSASITTKTNGQLNGDLAVTNLRLERFSTFFGTPLTGNINGVGHISGSILAPKFRLFAKGKQLGGRFTYGDSIFLVSMISKGKVNIDNLTIFDNNNKTKIYGYFSPIDKSINVNAHIRGAGVWIISFFDKYVSPKSCNISGDITVKHTINFPSLDGSINIRNMTVIENRTGIKIGNLNGTVSFKGREINLIGIKGIIGEGEVEANGSINLAKHSYKISTNLKNTFVNYNYINSIIDGNLTVKSGTRGTMIFGNINVGEATISIPFKSQPVGSKGLNNLYLDLTVDATNNNIWLKNENANLEMGGKMKIFYNWGDLLLSGKMETKRGKFYYYYKDFDVLRGTFEFNNTPVIDPKLDLLSRTVTTEGDSIFLNVSGTMRHPNFSLYSKPPHSSSEIIALLGLNLSWDELASLSSVEDAITNTAFNYFARRALAEKFKEKFGLDVFDIEKSRGYRLSVGKYITKSIFVKIGTEVSPYPRMEYTFEYRFSRWGSVYAGEDMFGNRRVLLNFKWRY